MSIYNLPVMTAERIRLSCLQPLLLAMAATLHNKQINKFQSTPKN